MNPQERVSTIARIVISIVSQATFIGAMIYAFASHDENMETMSLGAAIANATTVVQWWLGSSRSSEQKDATIHAALTGAGNGKVASAPGV